MFNFKEYKRYCIENNLSESNFRNLSNFKYYCDKLAGA